MVDAPERIWARPDPSTVYMDGSSPLTTRDREFRDAVEYVRADRIADLERQLAEARAEVAEHKRLKNQLVLKAYPAMDAIDEIAEGFRSAVHFVRNNAMNMERDYPEICHAEEVFSRARAASAGKE